MTLQKPYYQDEWVTIYHGDCREILPHLEKVDLVLTDPPYGVTKLEWDNDKTDYMITLIGIVRDNGAVIVFSTQPFTTKLIYENLKTFRYTWVWDKEITGNPLLAKYQPLKIHEEICVFSKEPHRYFPIMTKGIFRKKGGGRSKLLNMDMSASHNDEYYPVSILRFPNSARGEHPTQKPNGLISYLVQSYSMPNEMILDPFLGSGTTAYCAKKLNRKCVGIEIEEKYCEIVAKRCSQSVFNFGATK